MPEKKKTTVPVKKRGSHRNRRAGYDLEKLVAKELRDLGFGNVITARAGNRTRDALGVDLVLADEHLVGQLPYNIQCKNSTDRPQYDMLLDTMPQEPNVLNVVIHKYTIKQGSLFRPRGYYAILKMQEFFKMAAELKKLRAENAGLRAELAIENVLDKGGSSL